MGKPPNSVQVYPDPDGAASNSQYVPVNTVVQGASIASGAVAVGATAVGSGTATDLVTFLFQSVRGGSPDAVGNGFMGLHAIGSRYVAVILFFGALSLLLSIVNLVMGYQLRDKLRALSDKISGVCMEKGVFPGGSPKRRAATREPSLALIPPPPARKAGGGVPRAILRILRPRRCVNA